MSLNALSHWRNRGPLTPHTVPMDKKLVQGVCPAGENYYVDQVYAYDEAKRCWWTTQSSSELIWPLDHPYVWPLNDPAGHSQQGWNTTRDASPLSDYANGGPERATIKMDLDGTIWMDTLPAGITSLNLQLPDAFTEARKRETFQVQFAYPVPGAVLNNGGGSGATWASDDGGAGYLYTLQLTGQSVVLAQIVIPNTSAAVPGRKVNRPRIVPHPIHGKTKVSPEPVGYPPEIERLRHVGLLYRALDQGRYNGCSINGDTITQLRYRTEQPTDYLISSAAHDNPRISLAEQVQIANEAGIGLHCIFGHRDDLEALVPQHAETLKALDGPLVIEFSNECWNSTLGPQYLETTIEGIRRGFGTVSKSADAVPDPDLLWPTRSGNSTQTAMAHATGDKAIYTNPQGSFVVQARKALPKGSPLPTTWTNKAYKQGDITMGGTLHTLWVAKTDVPVGIMRGDSSYWDADPADVDERPWDLLHSTFEGSIAQWNYRSYMSQQIGDIVEAARIEAGKSPPVRIINVNPSTTAVRGDATGVNLGSNTEPYYMLTFDDLWRKNDWVMQSMYLLSAGLGSSTQPWSYTQSTPSIGYVAADKQAVYRTDISARDAIDAALGKMLSEASRSTQVDLIQTHLETLQNTGTYSLQKYLDAQVTAWNAAHPDDPQAPILAKIGWYECGIQSITAGQGWPDDAHAWDATKTYGPGYAQVNPGTDSSGTVIPGNFAKVGTQLYHCLQTSVGQDPTTNPDYWEVIPPCLDYDNQPHPRVVSLLNDLWLHSDAYTFIKQLMAMAQSFANAHQGGQFYSNILSSVRAFDTQPTSDFGYRFNDDETKAGSPAWFAACEVKQEWDLLP